MTRNHVGDLLYVGQSTKMDPESLATYIGSGDYFKQAIAEHGVESFTKEILGFYDDQADLDYAEVHAIARLRAEGFDLLNGGVGGPRAQREFIRAMFQRFRVVPQMVDGWFEAIEQNREEVRDLIAASAEITTDDFYREYEAQLLQTQDLSGACARCGAGAHEVCRTKTGNPAKNHVGRLTTA